MFANVFGNDGNCVCGLVWVCPISHGFRPIPLKSVSVSASVVHAVGQVEIRQVYVNSEHNPIEASYIFPLDSNGAVTHFHAELDGKIIKGVVKSSKDAERDYNKAIKNQKTAFLGEEVKPDVFKLKVGFLKPGALAQVVIGYVTEVKNDPDSHAIRFVIPTTVAPRYVPWSSSNDKKSQDLANMTFSDSTPAPMNIKVVVSIQGEIKTVESLSGHQIFMVSKGVIQERPGDWNKVVVSLAGIVTEMDRDFVLLVTPAEAVMHPRVYYEVLDNGSVAAMAHLIPSFVLKEEKVELIIVVDRSGSMSGQSIRMASAALQLFIHSLPTNCYFNIIAFSSAYESLFPRGSQKYCQWSLSKADEFAKGLVASGGTEILQPLQEVYSNPPICGYLRQIFVITDGEVSNTDEVIGLVKRNSHNSRLFALGIGAASSRHLVQGMATAGGGTCAFVEGDDSIQKATLSQLKNALQPSLTEIQVQWLRNCVKLNLEKTLFGYNKPLNPAESGGSKYEKFLQAPKNIPPIFDGNQMVVFGLFPPKMNKPHGVKLIADSPDGPLKIELQMNENNNLGKTDMLHKLAVIKLIREMELEDAAKPNSTVLQREIETLGIEHGITSKYTSFIAVDDSNKYVMGFGQMQFRQVPSQLPDLGLRSSMMCQRISVASSPFHSQQSDTAPRRNGRMCRQASMPDYSVPSQQKQSDRSAHRRLPSPIGGQMACYRMVVSSSQDDHSDLPFADEFADEDDTDVMMKDSIEINEPEMSMKTTHHHSHTNSDARRARARSATKGSSTSPKGERVREIINQQNFDGSFDLTEFLCRSLGLAFDDVKTEATKNGWDLSLWATALTWACLTTTDLKEEKILWELALNKAKMWMAQNCRDDNTLKDIRAKAIRHFSKVSNTGRKNSFGTPTKVRQGRERSDSCRQT